MTNEHQIKKHLRVSGGMTLGVFAFGVQGYHFLEHWSYFDSAYMTVITLAGVGFGEIHPLSNTGRGFTILLILLGMSIWGFTITTLIRAFSEGYFGHGLRQRRKAKMLAAMTGHTIVCGFGRVGQEICPYLNKALTVVIERKKELVELAEAQNFLVLTGDAGDDDILIQAGVLRAARLVCALPSDERSLYVLFSAKLLAPSIQMIARANTKQGEKKFKKIGVQHVVSVFSTSAEKMISHMKG